MQIHRYDPAPHVLVTGFEPFGGADVNPSAEVAMALHGQPLDGEVHIVGTVLPCAFGDALQALSQAIARHRPALVLGLGQADGRTDLSFERVAINVDDARIPDNQGRQPIDEPVVAGGPAAYFSTLPIKAMVAGLKAAGLPASVSQTAGTFVCNHVFYGLQHGLHGSGIRSGFVHVPLLPQQAARMAGVSPPCLALPVQVQAVALALRLAWQWQRERPAEADLRRQGGAIN